MKYACARVLQDTGGNQVERIWGLSVGFLTTAYADLVLSTRVPVKNYSSCTLLTERLIKLRSEGWKFGRKYKYHYRLKS